VADGFAMDRRLIKLSRRLGYSHQLIEEDDVQAVSEVLNSDFLTSGPAVTQFEDNLADFCGSKYCVAVSNGTAALMCAYYSIGLKAGDEVIIVSVGKRGIILKAPDKDGNVTVRAGIITTQTTVDNLRMADEKKSSDGKKTIKGAVSKSVSTSSFKSEVDLRGMTGDEAWFVVDKYIDTAYLAGVYSVTLIHGKGTGALRTALWNALKREPRVASFRAGAYGEGDYGVTVVEIKH